VSPVKVSPPTEGRSGESRNARATDRVRAELKSLRNAAGQRLHRTDNDDDETRRPRFAQRPKPL